MAEDEPMECPFCGLRVPGGAHEEIRHMEGFHPDIVAGRQRAVGNEPPPTVDFPARMRQLAEDFERYRDQLGHDPEWRDSMLTAVEVEMRHAIERARTDGS